MKAIYGTIGGMILFFIIIGSILFLSPNSSYQIAKEFCEKEGYDEMDFRGHMMFYCCNTITNTNYLEPKKCTPPLNIDYIKEMEK